jgi:hypothetical protein
MIPNATSRASSVLARTDEHSTPTACLTTCSCGHDTAPVGGGAEADEQHRQLAIAAAAVVVVAVVGINLPAGGGVGGSGRSHALALALALPSIPDACTALPRRRIGSRHRLTGAGFRTR